ncbi:MAG: hypothetical protein ACXABY_02290 [Candidatus Thorarchaeota archaeon]
MGYTTVEGRRVYGKFFNYGRFGPAEMPYKTFKKNRELLEEVNITGSWLENRFGGKFPQINFKLTEMWKVEFGLLVQIANCMGIEYKKSRHPNDTEKRALRKAILRRIDASMV